MLSTLWKYEVLTLMVFDFDGVMGEKLAGKTRFNLFGGFENL